jgi:hypothetical protein
MFEYVARLDANGWESEYDFDNVVVGSTGRGAGIDRNGFDYGWDGKWIDGNDRLAIVGGMSEGSGDCNYDYDFHAVRSYALNPGFVLRFWGISDTPEGGCNIH